MKHAAYAGIPWKTCSTFYLAVVTVFRTAGAFDSYSGHPDVCTAIIIIGTFINKTFKTITCLK